jgi:hypothetical protein
MVNLFRERESKAKRLIDGHETHDVIYPVTYFSRVDQHTPEPAVKESQTPINNRKNSNKFFLSSNSASFIDQNQAYTLIISYIVWRTTKNSSTVAFSVAFSLALSRFFYVIFLVFSRNLTDSFASRGTKRQTRLIIKSDYDA